MQNRDKRLSFLENIDNLEMDSDSKLILRIRMAAIVTSIILICFGLSVAYGWIFGNENLYRYVADTKSMVFNTAIIFITFGIIGLAIIFDKKYVVICGLLFIVALNIIAAVENIFAIDLYIDQIFFVNTDPLDTAYPGRISLLTAILNLIASVSVSVLFLSFFKTSKNIVISSAAAMFVLLVSISGLIGYFFDITTLYRWLSPVAISITTVVGFIVLSAYLCLANAYFYLLKKLSLYKQLPLFVSLALCILSLYLFAALRENEINLNIYSNLPTIVLVFGITISVMFFILLHLMVRRYLMYRQSTLATSILNATLESCSDAIIVFNKTGALLTYNSKFLKLWHLSTEDLDSKNVDLLYQLLSVNVIYASDLLSTLYQLVLKLHDQYNFVIKLKNTMTYQMYISPYELNNSVAGTVYCFSDITSESQLTEQLAHQNMYDPITNYPNRALACELVAQAIYDAKTSDNKIAIFFLDIDNFSDINSLFGRESADQLFKNIMDQIAKIISFKGTLGRMTGDEFIVIAKGFNNIGATSVILRQIQSVFEKSLTISSQEVSISCCIGVAIFPFDGQDSETLLMHADTALRQAKNRGRASVQFYSKEMNTMTQERLVLESQLRNAILEDNFIVYYQPIIDLKQNVPCGVEALVRMPGTNGELIPPDSFIKLAEDMGVISQLGRLVMLTACKQLKVWHDLGMKHLYISVNVSAQQLQSGILLQTINEALTVTGLDAKALLLEITESVLINISDELIFSLHGIASLGVKFAMDDFGTGYSSFNYAKQFPFSVVKIDRSFVVDVDKSERDIAIAKTIILMCKNLNYNALAEGVETKQQADLFASLDCDLAQGFYFSKPLSAKDCTVYLQAFSQHD